MKARHFMMSGRKTGVAAVAVLAGLAAVPPHAPQGPVGTTPGSKPTVVLVHGAFADGSSWSGVVERLQRDGYQVIAPANPLRGMPQDSTYLNSLLKSVKGPIVLVGHSYGGEVISQAAEGVDQVKALVYVNAIMPDKGESFSSLSAKFPPTKITGSFRQVPFRKGDGGTGTDVYIRADKIRSVFAQDLPERQTRIMAATQRPSRCRRSPTKSALWRGGKSLSMYSSESRTGPSIPVSNASRRSVPTRARHWRSIPPMSLSSLTRRLSRASSSPPPTTTSVNRRTGVRQSRRSRESFGGDGLNSISGVPAPRPGGTRGRRPCQE